MSMLGLKVGLRTMARTTGAFMKRNAPKILVGVGIAGFVGTAVSAGRATLKVRDILEAKDQKLIEIEFHKGLGAITEEEAQAEIKKTKRSATIGIITDGRLWYHQQQSCQIRRKRVRRGDQTA